MGRVPTRSDIYTAYKLETDGSKTKNFTNAVGNTVNYSGKKARLITAQEIAEITGASATTSPGIIWNEQSANMSDSYQFASASSYYWLIENLSETEYGNAAYWTSSPYINLNYNYHAWSLRSTFSLQHIPSDLEYLGLRPVITVPASSIVS